MLEKIITKLMSGRLYMVIAFTTTTCYLAWTGKIEPEVFVPLVAIIVQAYFYKERKQN